MNLSYVLFKDKLVYFINFWSQPQVVSRGTTDFGTSTFLCFVSLPWGLHYIF